jgi:hypothetical protein
MAYENYSIAELTAIYNKHADKPIKKFSTKTIALDRVLALAAEKGLSINGLLPDVEEQEDPSPEQPGEDAFPTPEPEAEEAEADEAAPESEAGEGSEPEGGEEEVEPTLTLQQRQREERSKSRKEAKAIKEGGSASEKRIIHVIKQIPAREGSFRAARAAVLRDGMTVGEYLTGAYEANGGKRPRHRYMSDIRRYVAQGFITVGE